MLNGLVTLTRGQVGSVLSEGSHEWVHVKSRPVLGSVVPCCSAAVLSGTWMGVILVPRGHFAMSGVIFGCRYREGAAGL